jgi:serine/threonine protein kinase
VFVGPGGHAWLADLGLSAFRGTHWLNNRADLEGTLPFLSPEQALLGHAAGTQASDVYALGATLYAALTLRPPFAGTDWRQVLERVGRQEPRRPRRVDRGIPRELEAVLLKAMAKEPGRRHTSALELAEDLRRFLAAGTDRTRR